MNDTKDTNIVWMSSYAYQSFSGTSNKLLFKYFILRIILTIGSSKKNGQLFIYIENII